MFNAKFISNCLPENIDDIKIAALYYDKIEIMANHVYTVTKPKTENINGKKCKISRIRGVYNCLTTEFSDNLKTLEREGVISYFESQDYTIAPIDSDKEDKMPQLMGVALQQTGYLLSKAEKKLWYEKKNKNGSYFNFDPEVEMIHKKFINDLKIGATVDFEFIYNYYRNLLNQLIYDISVGGTSLTSSGLVDYYIKSMYIQSLNKEAISNNHIKENKLSQIPTEAIKLFLPNVSQMPIDDILELRLKLKDELEKFRCFSLKLNKEIQETFNYKDIVHDTQRCVELALKPAINELTQKIKGSKLNIASKFIDELRDPKSYAPLVGSLFFNLPNHLTLLLSLGMAGSKITLESYKEAAEVKQNGLYYLIIGVNLSHVIPREKLHLPKDIKIWESLSDLQSQRRDSHETEYITYYTLY